MADEITRMRGAIASPRHKLAAATPHEVGSFPPNFAAVPSQLSYWGNNKWGDCVSAEEAAAKACYSVARGIPEVFVSEEDLIAWARKHHGLNGASLTEIMDAMQTDGLPANGKLYTDGPYTSVDWTDYRILCSAIYQGPVKIGIAAGQVEEVAGSSNGWWMAHARKDRNIDHCTGLVGYGTAQWCADAIKTTLPTGYLVDPATPCVLMFTWATIGILTHAALMAICGEAWLRSPTTIPDDSPPSPGPAPLPDPLLSVQTCVGFGTL